MATSAKDTLKTKNKTNIRDKTAAGSVTRTAIADGIDAAYDYTDTQLAAFREEVDTQTPGFSGNYSDLEGLPAIPAAYTDEQAAEASKPVVDTALEEFEIGLPVDDEDFDITTDAEGLATHIALNYAHVLGRATLGFDAATNKLTLTLAPGLDPLTVTLNNTSAAGSATTPTSPTFLALTDSGFTNKEGAVPLTFSAGPPPAFTAAQADFRSGANTGKWKLRLPAGKKGAVRFRFIDPAAMENCGLTLRTIDTFDHSGNQVDAELYVSGGKLCYIKAGAENAGTIAAVAGDYGLLVSDGVSLKGYRSADGLAYTELVSAFTNVNPATQDLYLGQNGHFGSKLTSPTYYGFEPY